MPASIRRRDLLWGGIALGALPARANDAPVLADWDLGGTGEAAFERVAGAADAVHRRSGKIESVGGPTGHALRFDGYSTWVTRDAARAPHMQGAFAIELWTALETWPVSSAAFVNQHRRNLAGYSLGLSPYGKWGFGLCLSGVWHDCAAPAPLPRNQWLHLVASFDPGEGISLYQNGALVNRLAGAKGSFEPARDVDLLIGRDNESASAAGVFDTGVINGIMGPVRIYGRALTSKDVNSAWRGAETSSPPRLAIPASRFSGDPHRPRYHAKPGAAWTNEPHGLIRWNGAYHLFYQKNANGPYWGQIHWGHLRSEDLVHWADAPIALAPEPGYDQKGCWSGSAKVHRGTPSILYTGADGNKACICLATSQGDLSRWTKHPGNPVIPAAPEGLDLDDFRDPFVWEENGQCYAIIGSGFKGKGGTALLYKSADLVHWTFLKPLLTGDRGESGRFWEMPVFFPVGGRHALIVCEVPGRASYWIGTWKDETFTPDSAKPRHLDLINHFLSPTPYLDAAGNVTVIGISPDTRGRDEAWKAGWAHVYGLPRLLSLSADGALRQAPSPQLQSLRKSRLVVEKRVLSSERVPVDVLGNTLEIIATFLPGDAQRFGLSLYGSPGGEEETLLYYDASSASVTLDRRRSSLNPAVQRTVAGDAFQLAPGEPLVLHVFLDRSMLDVFVCGRAAFTSRVYPGRDDSRLVRVFAENGSATLESLEAWLMDETECVS